MNEPTKTQTILIDLQESSNAKNFKDEANLIHYREFERAKRWIEHRIDHIDSQREAGVRMADTISIFGSRGSGKTTFLLSLVKRYENHPDLAAIRVIDPTLIEEKGHIFLTILTQIKKLVKNHRSLNCCDRIEHPDHLKEKCWEQKLQELAAGLPTIDGVTRSINESDWQDAQYIMKKGLTSVQAAFELEERFNRFLDMSLEIIGKKGILLAFDDVDIDFTRGWPVLETLRKYLTSPRIITVISGDLKLFSKAIRKMQWKNFGKALLKNEGEDLKKMEEYNSLVTEMESQYLQKVLKPERRIHLNSIYEKICIAKADIRIKGFPGSPGNAPKPITEFYRNYLETFGIRNRYQAESYIQFLESLPIRTQIQLLNQPGALNDPLGESNNLLSPFMSDLLEKRVDIDLAINNPKLITSVTLQLLIREKDLATGYQLQPTTTDNSLNNSYMALTMLLSRRSRDTPYLLFDFMLKIAYMQNLWGSLSQPNRTQGTIEGLCQHAGVYQERVLRDIMGSTIAYMESALGTDTIVGSIPLPAFQYSRRTPDAKGRFDIVFRNAEHYQQVLAYLPLSLSQYPHKNEVIRNFSIYTLLSTIGEFAEKIRLNDMKRGIIELSQVRTYPMLSFGLGAKEELGSRLIDQFELSENDNSDTIIQAFRSWIDAYGQVAAVAPHMLGKIATRFYFSLKNMMTDDGLESIDNLGDLFHMQIIAFMNTVLIEDIRENNEEIAGLNINNTRLDERIFVQNLKVAQRETIRQTSFSRWMLACPLLLMYLRRESNDQYYELLKTYISDPAEQTEKLIKRSIHKQLKQVLLKESKISRNPANADDMPKKPKFRSTKAFERMAVIEALIEAGASFNLFRIGTSVKETQQMNETIRRKYTSLFEEKELTSEQIRDFRKYLNGSGSNLPIVARWKQHQ